MKNIDIEIYKNNLMEEIPFDELAEEYDCKDIDCLKNLFLNEIEVMVESNFIEREDPTLTLEQFEEAMSFSITQYHLDLLVKEGLLEANFDLEQGENVYKLTEKGKEVGKYI